MDRVNSDPEYLRGKICEAFPELSSGGRDSRMFKLWQVRENRTELIPLPVDINNAQALFTYEELNRSCVYIKADVSIYTIHHIILIRPLVNVVLKATSVSCMSLFSF